MAQLTGIQVPDGNWNCSQWINYHKELKDSFGKGNANTIWLYSWQKLGQEGILSSLIGNCAQDPDFNNYFDKQGINVGNALDESVASISQIGNNIFGLGEMATKVIMYGVPVVLIMILVPVSMFLFRAGKSASVSDVASFTPVGRLK